MSSYNDRFMMKVVSMYYKEELSQEVIARKMNVSRATISRALTRAKNEGVVKIVINYFDEDTLDLENKIEEKFNIKEAIIGSNSSENGEGDVELQAAGYLMRVLKSDNTIGVAYGSTIKKMVDKLEEEGKGKKLGVKNVKVAPFVGAAPAIDEDYYFKQSNILATRIGKIFGGKGYNLMAPVYVSNNEVKKIIESEEQVANVLNIVKNSDIAIIGIGELYVNPSNTLDGLFGEEEYKLFKTRGGVGEIMGRVYDSNGNIIDSDLNKKMIGLSLDDLRKIPLRIGIAYGERKAEAIKGALQGGFVNVIVTDNITARAIIE